MTPPVEILAPLRIETRFLPPDAARPTWILQLRVFPDEFSMERGQLPATPEELDRLDEFLARTDGPDAIDEPSAFTALAAAVGTARAVWLRRTVPVIAGAPPHADRAGAVPRDPGAIAPHLPAGLPPQLNVWVVAGGSPTLVQTLTLNREEIADDMSLVIFQVEESVIREGRLPETWWTSYERAKLLGLGADIDLGPADPAIEVLVVTGLGDRESADLVAAHAASGRLAVLAPGTPTNTVDGEATAELGRDPDAWVALAGADVATQPSSTDVVLALGGTAAAPEPLQGGDLDHLAPGAVAVRALWPALWSRALRDVAGAGSGEVEIEEWALEHLAPQGPLPAVRVGEQPYALLPATALGNMWIPDPNAPGIEVRLADWTSYWMPWAAEAAEAEGTSVGASTDRLLELMGLSAPSSAWGVRVVAPLPAAQSMRAQAGLPGIDVTRWDEATAQTLAGLGGPDAPVAPVSALFPLEDRGDDPDLLDRLLGSDSEPLLYWDYPLGFLGHLLRASLLLARATAGLAAEAVADGNPIDPAARLPLDPMSGDDDVLADLVMRGDDAGLRAIENSGDPGRYDVLRRVERAIKATRELVARWVDDRDTIEAAVRATLDTAAFRVDPWVIGIAERRRRALVQDGAACVLGAYGWVDAPAPYTAAPDGPLAPGPTAAGLLHAPSHTQALTAALLRDAAVRDPSDDRWALTLDSAKVRAAARLAERVRLGVHVYEALGLEVERLTADPDAVRILRREFPLRDEHKGRRACDGARVLRAVLHGAEPVPADLPADLADRLQPLQDVLDTYGDLLVADGVHALVSGRGDLAAAAMEAAAGLGAPPELRVARTPRASRTVRVSAWALLPAPSADAGDLPAVAADPAFAALLDAELGTPAHWTWTVDGAAVSLADLHLHGAELVSLDDTLVAALLRAGADEPAPVASSGGAERLAQARRLAALLGGGDEDPLAPGLVSGRDDVQGAAPAVAGDGLDAQRAALDADNARRAEMTADLFGRLTAMVVRATAAKATLAVADAGAVATARVTAARWGIDGDAQTAAVELGARLQAASTVTAATAPGALRLAIRALAGHARTPVLPVVPRTALPTLTPSVADAEHHPALDQAWLEVVAATSTRLAALEARQLDRARVPWPAATWTADGSLDPWTPAGPVLVAYGPGVRSQSPGVAIAVLDAWSDSVPARTHATSAAYGFNGPKSRAPQAILLGVPPDLDHRMTDDELLELVLQTRALAHARAARPTIAGRVATPAPLLNATGRLNFLEGW